MDKQTKKLRSEGKALAPIMAIGKEGITSGTITQLEKELKSKRLVKIQIRPSACGEENPKKDRERIVAELAEKTRSQIIDRVGHMAVLHR